MAVAPDQSSRSKLVEELRRLDAGSQTPVGATDLPYSLWFALRSEFGSLEAAREAARVRAPDLSRRWSKEEVVAALRRLHADGVRITELGMKDDHGDVLGAVQKYFGSIVLARRAARVPEPAPIGGGKRQRWDEQRVILEIEELQRNGESIAASKVPNPLLKAGKRYFGSWKAAVEAAGVAYDDVRLAREAYTEQTVLAELRALSKQRPQMTMGELYACGFTPAVYRFFGGFEQALERARLVDWPERARSPAMSREEVIAAIRRREREGKATNQGAVSRDDHHLWYSGAVHFGEWRLAAEAAGVDLAEHNRSWTPESIIAALREREWAGLSIRSSDVKREDSRLYGSAIAYFGSYALALERVKAGPHP